MTKRSDPILDPDPMWIKSSGSYRIRIHNTDSINILFLFFRYVRMNNYPFHNFSFLPTLSTSWKSSYFAARRWREPAYWYCSFYRKLFFCTIFYPSFLVYDASFSVVIYRNHCFFAFRNKRTLKGIVYYKLKCQGAHEREGLVIIFRIFINAPLCKT